MLSGTVNLFGHPVKKGYVLIAVLLLGAGIVWEYRRRQDAGAAAAVPGQQAAAAAAGQAVPASSGDPYPPDGTTGNPADPYSTDPASGETYGDEQASGFSGFSDGGGFDAGGGLGFLGDASGTQPQAFTSNGQWAQAAEQYLASQGGSASPISAALGKYITGQAVTADQQVIIEEAIAFENYPPVAGSSGFPPSIHLQSASGGGGTGATVPRVEGLTYGQASDVLHAAGFKPERAAGYHDPVTAQDPRAGAHAKAGTVIRLTGSKAAPKKGRQPAGPDKDVTANGKQSLAQIAIANHVSFADIKRWNPDLVKYGTKPVPQGTKVKV